MTDNGRLVGEYDATGQPIQETVWLNDMPVAVLKGPDTPPPTIASCYSPFAANERLEVRSGRPGAADWEWGLGANTQQSGLLVNINNIDWVSGKAVRYELVYDGNGNGTLTLRDSITNATLATRTYTNTTNPLRIGNALKLYVKQNAAIGVGAKVRATVSSINGTALATPLDLETNGNNTFQDKSAYAEVVTPAGATGMRVEGEITMTWVGAANAIPTGSRLGVTINAGSAPCVASGTGSGGTTTGGGTTTPTAGITSASWLYYAHPDHLGIPRTITKSTDNIKVWEWRNDDAFGNNLPDENPGNANAQAFQYNLRLPGQYYDAETNTHYNYFRDYDPSIGRYVQSDPIGLNGGINTYGYVGGSPLTDVDPLGLAACTVLFPDYPVGYADGRTSTWLGGHGGVLSYDAQGSTRYYEFGRYSPTLADVIGNKRPAEEGNVQRVRIPDLVIDPKTGQPTPASLEALKKELSRLAGKNTKTELTCDKDADEKKVNKYAEDFANDKNRPPYSWKPWSSNQCRDFARRAFGAGK